MSASGLIQGAPTQSGVFSVGLGATNILGTGNASLTITIGPRIPTPPVITSSLAASGVLNVPYFYQITATNTPTSYSAANLPSWLVINSTTGTITGMPTQSGSFTVTIAATNADGTDTRTLTLTITNVASLLAQALDSPQLIFTTGGDVPWVVPATSTHDGVDAAESGNVGDNQQSWLETKVTGPAFVKFWFQLDSEAGYDFFRFSIDDEELWYSDGFHAWRLLGFYVPPGIHTLRWNYTKDDIYSTGADRLYVDQIEIQGVQQLLGETLDNPNLNWQMPSAQAWVLQNRRTVDSTDALISPIYLDHSRSSVVETPVMGPGTVSFSWTVSSEPNADFFRFEIDGTVISQISGNSNGNNLPWAQGVFAVPAGEHMLRWRYIKNESTVAGLDACWLDAVAYTPSFSAGPPYAQWLNGAFPVTQLGNALISGPNADTDGDGRTNLHEYAFGGSPLERDSVPLTSPTPVGSEVFFGYSIADWKTDLTITPRVSDDLNNWTNATPEPVTPSGGQTHWRVRLPQSAGKKFLVLRAGLAQ